MSFSMYSSVFTIIYSDYMHTSISNILILTNDITFSVTYIGIKFSVVQYTH